MHRDTIMKVTNKMQVYRRPVCRADNHLLAPNVLKSGSLKLLEPSGSVQACNGIALPLPLLHTHMAYSIHYDYFLFQATNMNYISRKSNYSAIRQIRLALTLSALLTIGYFYEEY